MKARIYLRVSIFVVALSAASLAAQEPVYWDVVQQIMEEAFENSQVMENASWLTDVFGPRNSKSSGYVEASEWAKERLKEYGLSNARLEPFEFGVGWENKYTSIHMMTPQYMPIIAYPAPWSRGTNGKILAPAIHINFDEIKSKAELDKYGKKIKGAMIFMQPKQKITPRYEPLTRSYPPGSSGRRPARTSPLPERDPARSLASATPR